MCALQFGVFQFDTTQIAITQIRVGKIGLHHYATTQIGATQICARKMGVI